VGATVNLKGSLSMLILHIVAGEPSHGYQIAKLIKQQSEGVLDFKEGTLYPTLHSLEEQGLLEAYTQVENGRTRRYYRLTEAGGTMQKQQRAEWQRYARAVNLILEEAT
jgi:transcriptional regulator